MLKPPGSELLLMLDSVIVSRSALYVAGPLDTGREYFILKSKQRTITAELRQANESRISCFVANLRKKRNCPVIDPGLLRCPNWNGTDYGMFFLEVINRYVSEMWFINGWEFSLGATKEFVLSQKRDLPCFDEAGDRISNPTGAKLIEHACLLITSLNQDPSLLFDRLSALKQPNEA